MISLSSLINKETHTMKKGEYHYFFFMVNGYRVFVRKNPNGHIWGSCDCLGYKFKKKCKHLEHCFDEI